MTIIQVTSKTVQGERALRQHMKEADSQTNKALKAMLRRLTGNRNEPFINRVTNEKPFTVQIVVADPMLAKAITKEALIEKAHESMRANGARKGTDYEVLAL